MNVKQTWVETIKGTIPDYAEDIADRLTIYMASSGDPANDVMIHGCALAAASATANGGLAFEISMNGPLFRSDERDIAKKAAVLVTLAYSRHSAALGPGGREGRIYEPDSQHYSLYAYAASVAIGDEYLIRHYAAELDEWHIAIEQRNLIAEVASTIAAIGKIT